MRLRGGKLELLLVLENMAGARLRETFSYSTRNSIDAVKRVAKQLAYRGDVATVKNARFRREERGELKDDAELRRIFISEFAYHNEDDAWD